ncbi:hypothetical protein BHM03_00060191 [Ensete ventricosum]|uniref:Uncharacterized protein n=1 Tax=Ensete ventricosum TaxID=4639 RepID=A0A445MMR6_ENSVE|nr:hypothetical protein BHM03_00060191 [Ensete ventricosum]
MSQRTQMPYVIHGSNNFLKRKSTRILRESTAFFPSSRDSKNSYLLESIIKRTEKIGRAACCLSSERRNLIALRALSLSSIKRNRVVSKQSKGKRSRNYEFISGASDEIDHVPYAMAMREATAIVRRLALELPHDETLEPLHVLVTEERQPQEIRRHLRLLARRRGEGNRPEGFTALLEFAAEEMI